MQIVSFPQSKLFFEESGTCRKLQIPTGGQKDITAPPKQAVMA